MHAPIFSSFYKTSAFIVLLLGAVSTTAAQPYDLKPENWFPLDVGSYWHYQYENQGWVTDALQKADQDSVIDGQRWTRIKTVYCNIPVACSTEVQVWYSFTEDHYLLASSTTPDRATADTMLATQPRSVFAANLPRDTLYSARVTDPVSVTLQENSVGHAADSTNLTLFVTAKDDIFFTEGFVYKIGRAFNLIGAIVGNLRYGNTSLITSVALPLETPTNRSIPSLTVDVFPNPAREMPMIRLQASEEGLYQVAIYNVLGQRVFEDEQRLIPQAWWQPKWQTARPPDGVYFIQIKRDSLLQTSTSFILAR